MSVINDTVIRCKAFWFDLNLRKENISTLLIINFVEIFAQFSHNF
jgi:hypothetical protein